MPMVINIDVMLAKREMSIAGLSEKVGIAIANLSMGRLRRCACLLWRRFVGRWSVENNTESRSS